MQYSQAFSSPYHRTRSASVRFCVPACPGMHACAGRPPRIRMRCARLTALAAQEAREAALESEAARRLRSAMPWADAKLAPELVWQGAAASCDLRPQRRREQISEQCSVPCFTSEHSSQAGAIALYGVRAGRLSPHFRGWAALVACPLAAYPGLPRRGGDTPPSPAPPRSCLQRGAEGVRDGSRRELLATPRPPRGSLLCRSGEETACADVLEHQFGRAQQPRSAAHSREQGGVLALADAVGCIARPGCGFLESQDAKGCEARQGSERTGSSSRGPARLPRHVGSRGVDPAALRFCHHFSDTSLRKGFARRTYLARARKLHRRWSAMLSKRTWASPTPEGAHEGMAAAWPGQMIALVLVAGIQQSLHRTYIRWSCFTLADLGQAWAWLQRHGRAASPLVAWDAAQQTSLLKVGVVAASAEGVVLVLDVARWGALALALERGA